MRSFLITVALVGFTSAASAETGMLLLAHGQHSMAGHEHHDAAPNPWNANVEALARTLNASQPTEVAFGMADPKTMQAAVDRLEKRGVTNIVAVPLFISSHSPIIQNFQYILGVRDKLADKTSLKHLDRVTKKANVRFAGAMDAHPRVSEILLDRAKTLTADPATATVILIAHGPNDEEDNKMWLKDMQAHAAFLRAKGGFREVEVLTHRNDADAAIKGAAKAEFRKRVEAASKVGTVVVVPLLMSEGGIEKEVEGDLKGLSYKFGRPLMPHPNIAKWVEAEYKSKLPVP